MMLDRWLSKSSAVSLCVLGASLSEPDLTALASRSGGDGHHLGCLVRAAGAEHLAVVRADHLT